MVIIITEVGKTCPNCGKFFVGNKCPDCGWELLSIIPKPIKRGKKGKKKLKRVLR